MNRIGLLLVLAIFSMQLNAASGRFLVITDLHFNPFFDSSLEAELKAKPATEWSDIFASTKIKGFGDYGGTDETNNALFTSALADAARRQPDPDFVLVTGDVIAHRFHTGFGVSAPTPEHKALVLKTFRYVLRRIAETFPNKPVYFTLGNNDAYCGNYKVAPEGRFLDDTAKLITSNLLLEPAEVVAITASYVKGGYYSIRLQEGQGRMIAINTILFSPKHYKEEKTCGPELDYDPATAQFQWLEKELKAANSKGEPVWLLLHLPPGADVYATLKAAQFMPMWRPQDLSRYLELVRRYGTSIRATFAGHTHMDNFRLLYADRQGSPAYGYVRISPGVSPQAGNNPAYSLYRYDINTFTPSNFEVYYLNIAKGGKGGWQFEYDFAKRYGAPSLSAENLDRIRASLLTDAKRRKTWTELYNVSHTAEPKIDDTNFKEYWCGINRLTEEAFTKCYR